MENLSRWDLAGSATYKNNPDGGASVEVIIPLTNQAAKKEPSKSEDKAVVRTRADMSTKSLI